MNKKIKFTLAVEEPLYYDPVLREKEIEFEWNGKGDALKIARKKLSQTMGKRKYEEHSWVWLE